MIEQAEALGEPPEDPLLLIYVLYGFWVANLGAFNGDVIRDLAAHFLALAEKQGATIPLMIGHRLMGVSLLCTGDIAQGRAHLDRAIALYDPAEHRPLATRFGHDTGVVVLTFRSWALWLLGYPEAALKDADDALKNAREMGRAATLMHALSRIGILHILCGNYSVATARTSELFALAEEKGCLVLEGGRNGAPRLRIDPDRQSLGRSPHDHLRNHRIAINGSNTVCAVVSIAFRQGLCGARQNR